MHCPIPRSNLSSVHLLTKGIPADSSLEDLVAAVDRLPPSLPIEPNSRSVAYSDACAIARGVVNEMVKIRRQQLELHEVTTRLCSAGWA